MKKKDKILRLILIVFFFLVFTNILIADFIHIQTCTIIDRKIERNCEEEVAEQAKNCKYVFLFWQKVEPSQKDIDTCIRYREQGKK